MVQTVNAWHTTNTALGRRQLYHRAGSAGKRGYIDLHNYYKAMADAAYAAEKGNSDEAAQHLETALQLVDSAKVEYDKYLQEDGPMA